VITLVDREPEADGYGGGPLLEVRDLTVDYDTSGEPVTAVEHVDLDVGSGEFVGIVGESGCGKSTLLFAIAQLLTSPARIAGGEVIFRGRNMVAMNESELAPIIVSNSVFGWS
jgi:peptide/nickel transport system ATP-binding protein